MDHIAALADILPPVPPPALPPAPWWQGTEVWLLMGLVLSVLIWAMFWLRRSRRWRHLRAVARRAMRDETNPQQAATILAGQLRKLLPEPDWPQDLRAALDALRFAAQTGQASVTLARDTLHRLADAIRLASGRAACAAWGRSTWSHGVFVRALRKALRGWK